MERREEWGGRPLGALLAAGLSPEAKVEVERVADLGRRRGDRVYLVGGLVRDLLLGVPHRDLDLMVEGDGLAFAAALAAEGGGSARKHEEFLTALVTLPDGFEIDVVGARAERYAAPAALPRVEPGDLRSDLLRRDFAVNALALQLSPGAAPVLVDPAGGAADLEARRLRILHAGSFLDDPTRLLRGVRLETRLAFRFDPETEARAREAVAGGIFDRLSGSRLRHELVLLLEEPEGAAPGLERLAGLGALAAFHPALRWSPEVAASLAAAEGHLAAPRARAIAAGAAGFRRWRFLWMALSRAAAAASGGGAPAFAETIDALGARLLPEGGDAEVILGFPERLARARRELERREGGALVPHRVAEALSPLSGEELLLLAGEETLLPAIDLFVGSLRSTRSALRGADLVAAGVPPGPAVGAALRAALRARWDGEVEAGGELAFALAHLARERSREAAGGGASGAEGSEARLAGNGAEGRRG